MTRRNDHFRYISVEKYISLLPANVRHFHERFPLRRVSLTIETYSQLKKKVIMTVKLGMFVASGKSAERVEKVVFVEGRSINLNNVGMCLSQRLLFNPKHNVSCSAKPCHIEKSKQTTTTTHCLCRL